MGLKLHVSFSRASLVRAVPNIRGAMLAFVLFINKINYLSLLIQMTKLDLLSYTLVHVGTGKGHKVLI